MACPGDYTLPPSLSSGDLEGGVMCFKGEHLGSVAASATDSMTGQGSPCHSPGVLTPSAIQVSLGDRTHAPSPELVTRGVD